MFMGGLIHVPYTPHDGTTCSPLSVVITPFVVLVTSGLNRHPEPLLFSDWGGRENVKIRDSFLQHLSTPESVVPSLAAKAVSPKIL